MIPRACRDMLKNRKIASDLLKQRLEKQSRRSNITLNNAEIKVVGNNSIGFFPTFAIKSEGSTYLFNCNEGTQRFCFSNGIKLLNLENVFITNHTWERLSGIHGLTLTLQDLGVPTITIHSNCKIEEFFDATSSFALYNTGIELKVRSYIDGDFDDTGLRVKPIPIDTTVYQNNDHKRSKFQTNLIAYACMLPDLPGALNPGKCRELKVPVGKLLSVLKAGEDVTLPDGRLIKSSDVCEPKQKGQMLIVLECPSTKEIDAVVRNETLAKLREHRRSVDERQVDIVIHISPREVTSNLKYQDWMNGFDRNCQHVFIIDTDQKMINFVDSYRQQYLLNQIDSEIFPHLELTSKFAEQVKSEMSSQLDSPPVSFAGADDASDATTQLSVKEFPNPSTNIIELNSLSHISLRPKVEMVVDESPNNIDILYNGAKLLPNFNETLTELRKAQQNLPEPEQYEPEVVFLGTGSAAPSKLRNTSSILLNFNVPSPISVMLDCGEDTFGQLSRFYGPKRLKDVIKRLEIVYISHHHADHHLGLIKLLSYRKKLTNKPISLLLPPGIERLLEYHNKNFENLRDTYEIFSNILMKTSPLTGMSEKSSTFIKSELKKRNGCFLDDIQLVAVDHCVNACAVTMRFKIGHPKMDIFTIAYSGDARPCEEFVIAGKDCDLLIHEATFDHRSDNLAVTKKHSTSKEAIVVSKKMGAKFTILTHFSARFSRIPYITEDFDNKIGFAFDYMSFRCPTHYARVPLLKDTLSIVFKKSLDEIDKKYHKAEEKKKFIEDMLKEEISR